MDDKGRYTERSHEVSSVRRNQISDLVLDKGIFSVLFDKDIRRVFIYKKAERLAKALQMVRPAFSYSTSLKDKIDTIAIGIIDAASCTPAISRDSLSRELLTLSSILGAAREGGALSPMNAGIIMREAQGLLQEICEYEEPGVTLGHIPTLADLGKAIMTRHPREDGRVLPRRSAHSAEESEKDIERTYKGHIKDNIGSRSDSILAILKDKKTLYIKDISTLIRGVSEKTIQRDLQALVKSGKVIVQGKKRWTTYALNETPETKEIS